MIRHFRFFVATFLGLIMFSLSSHSVWAAGEESATIFVPNQGPEMKLQLFFPGKSAFSSAQKAMQALKVEVEKNHHAKGKGDTKEHSIKIKCEIAVHQLVVKDDAVYRAVCRYSPPLSLARDEPHSTKFGEFDSPQKVLQFVREFVDEQEKRNEFKNPLRHRPISVRYA